MAQLRRRSLLLIPTGVILASIVAALLLHVFHPTSDLLTADAKQRGTTSVNSTSRLAIGMSVLPGTRDPLLWPFASKSIWNMPVGSKAAYVPAHFAPAGVSTGDDNYFIRTTNADPFRPVYQPGAFGPGRCNSSQRLGSNTVRIPDNVIVPDATSDSTPNNAAAILQPDGRSMVQFEPLARCTAGGNVYGWISCGWGSTQDIEGDGLCGGHSGSGLSSIGGELRLGELTNSQPIRHALQLEVWMEAYAYYAKDRLGYRWPASMADSYASQSYCHRDPCHTHPNPALVQGSLLAIPPTVKPESLGLTTNAGKKMFFALQNYGGYLVDDTAGDNFQIGTEIGVQDEFEKQYGYAFGTGAFHKDINKLFVALQIIDNNGPTTIGGGGTPLQPLAPAFSK